MGLLKSPLFKTLLRYLLSGIGILLLLLFVLNNFFKNNNRHSINADGVGYFDYLPSVFVYHDLIRKDVKNSDSLSLYSRINEMDVYLDYKDHKVNKYAVGTAVMILPFYLFTYAIIPGNLTIQDAYNSKFQTTVLVAALFYVILSLVFLAKLLALYKINLWLIRFLQLLLVFASPVAHYATLDAGFSHVYSMFAILLFLFFSKRFFVFFKAKDFYLAAFSLGLIIICRQFNVLIVFTLPFLAANFESLKMAFHNLTAKPLKIIIGFLIVFLVFSIQMIVWYLQSGHFLLDSYQDSKFNFLHPHFYDVLFSFQKGLFVYTPVLLFALFFVLLKIIKRQYYLAFSWFFAFLIINYFISSWEYWQYGASFGMRPYIDFLAFFFIAIALFLNEVNKWFKVVFIPLSLFFVLLNLIQIYQYNNFIIRWMDMDFPSYKKVFMKTSDRFIGYLWKDKNYPMDSNCLQRIDYGNITINKKDEFFKIVEEKTLKELKIDSFNMVEICFMNTFNENLDSKVIVSYSDLNNKPLLWQEISMISFADGDFGKRQSGRFMYPIPETFSMDSLKMSVLIKAKEIQTLEKFSLKFY